MRSSLAALVALGCFCPLTALAQTKPAPAPAKPAPDAPAPPKPAPGKPAPPEAPVKAAPAPAPAPPPKPAPPAPAPGTQPTDAPVQPAPPTGSLPPAPDAAAPPTDATGTPAPGDTAATPPPEPATSDTQAPGSDAAPQEEEAEDEEEEPELEVIPPANDTLGGHIALAASGAYALPFGSLDESMSQRRGLGSGGAIGLDLGLGVSRSVVIGAWAQLALFGPNEQSFALGPFVRYHLVQGVRFDPWISAGVGFRTTTVTFQDRSSEYSGIEWLRIQMGGDWYPWKNVGIGPFSELDLGVFGNIPDDSKDTDVHFMFLTGARLTLDFPGK